MRFLKKFILEFWLSSKYIFGKKQEAFISFTSIFSILSVLIGVAILILVMSVMNGFSIELRNRLIGLGAHIQITKFGDEKNYYLIKKNFLENKNIAQVAPFVRKQLMFSYGTENYLITLDGINPESEKKATNLAAYLIKGKINLKNNGIIIGKEFARYFGYQLGDSVYFTNPTTKKKIAFKIQGIFYTGAYIYDLNLAYIDLKFAQKIFGMPNTISGYKIKLFNEDKANFTKQDLLKKLNIRYDVNTWLDLNKSLISAMQIERKIMFIILSLLLLLAGFNISTTLMMKVMEKKKDIGVLKSLGFSNKAIKRIFIYQGLILSLAGIFLGLITGFILTLNINFIMDIVEKITGFKIILSDAYYLAEIPVYFNYYNILLTVLFCFLIAVIAAYYPALKASKLEPIEVLKDE